MNANSNMNMMAILDNLPCPAYVSDSSEIIIYTNDLFCRLVEKSGEDILGKQMDFLNGNGTTLIPDTIGLAGNADTMIRETIFKIKNNNNREQVILRRSRETTLQDNTKGMINTLLDVSSFVLYEKELEEKQRDLRRQQSKLKALADIDPLTGILNRRSFYNRAEELITYAEVGNLDVGVLMFDLDRFKLLNDTHGHAVGDAVLVLFTKLTEDCIRSSDIFARIGGEEFAILLPDTNVEAMKTIAVRIRESVAQTPVIVGDKPVYFTVSVGGTMLLNDENNIDSALNRADQCLYRAKEDGRDRFVFSKDNLESN